MACNCNTPTFVVQTGLSISPSLQSGNALSFAEEQAEYRIAISGGCCCGEDDATVITTGFIYDGTYFYDGAKVFQ